ncbi:sugar phosphate isomerase/epimerase [Paenibacillus sp. P26]|nr:sugar phosphate isomerase/epimerase [Paenibacillus sp. P26]
MEVSTDEAVRIYRRHPGFDPGRIRRRAKAAGIEGVEWRFKEIPEEAKDEKPSFWRRNLCSIDPKASEEELARFERVTKEHGLETVSVTPYLTTGDLEGTEQVLRVAKRLGARTIRVGVPRYDGTQNYNELFDQAVKYLHGVEELAKQYGIKCLVETHHVTIAPSAGLAHRLVSGFSPDHIGVLFDPGNMVHEGYENFRMGLELLGPYLAHVHIKNTGWKRTEQTGRRVAGLDFLLGAGERRHRRLEAGAPRSESRRLRRLSRRGGFQRQVRLQGVAHQLREAGTGLARGDLKPRIAVSLAG